jgi:transcription initiation factor IIE alpha subunit
MILEVIYPRRLRSLGLTDEQIANALEIEIDRVTKILGE